MAAGTQSLWKRGLLNVYRELNLAHALTKYWSKADGMNHFLQMSLQTASQRGSLAEETARNLTTRTTSEERTCCMRELVWECPPLGYDTHAVGRPPRARERRQAKEIVRFRSSRCQGVDTDAKDTWNERYEFVCISGKCCNVVENNSKRWEMFFVW